MRLVPRLDRKDVKAFPHSLLAHICRVVKDDIHAPAFVNVNFAVPAGPTLCRIQMGQSVSAAKFAGFRQNGLSGVLEAVRENAYGNVP